MEGDDVEARSLRIEVGQVREFAARKVSHNGFPGSKCHATEVTEVIAGFPEPRTISASKRAFDLAILALVVPFAAPVAALAAFWVWLVSGGNVLFVQERVGHGGRRFRCYKLRTMKEGCTSSVHERHLKQLLTEDKPMNKLDSGDSRLIPGARILRALGIDELPQLINVLKGDMSVIGPRPCIPYEAQQYELWQRERFAALPGLTGLWQVRGKNKTTFTQMIRLDIEYVRRQSFWLDVQILLVTPKALLGQLVSAISNRSRRSHPQLSPATPVPMRTTDGSGVVG